MDEFLQQLLIAAEAGMYYLAILGALTVPDICAGLESEDGLTNGERYRSWFDQWVAPKYAVGPERTPSFTGEDAWRFRCSMLHHGTTQHPASRYVRVLFVPSGPNGNVFHNNVLNDALNLDIPTFCNDVVQSALSWRSVVDASGTYRRNLDKFVRVHPTGVPPYIVGSPVIS